MGYIVLGTYFFSLINRRALKFDRSSAMGARPSGTCKIRSLFCHVSPPTNQRALSNIQIAHFQCVFLDELAAAPHVFAPPRSKNFLAASAIAPRPLCTSAVFRVPR